ncbi:MAG: hypothetical protein ABI690_12560 [Chloroflexota bacterium]
MGIQVQWDVQDPDILVFDLRAQWDWNEFHAAVRDGISMMNSLTQPVYVITLSAHGFPPSSSVLSEFQKVMRILPQNVALIVVVTDNFMVETINQIFFRVSPLGRRIGRLAKTIDAARVLIAEDRAKRHAS